MARHFIGAALVSLAAVALPARAAFCPRLKQKAKMAGRLGYLASWMIVVLAALSHGAWGTEDCHLQMVATLPIELGNRGGMYVPITIAGKDLRLLIDTGSIVSMLTDSTVASLDLSRTNIEHGYLLLFGGAKIKQVVTAREVVLGGLHAKSLRFVVMPDGLLSDGMNGTLGPDLLLNFDLDFDFGNSKLNLFSPHHCEGRIIYWTKDPTYAHVPFSLNNQGQIEFHVTLDGKDLRVTLDTGSVHSVMSLETAKELFGIADGNIDLKPTQDRDHPTFRYPFKQLTLDGVVVSNPAIDLISDKDSHMDSGPRLILGLSIMKQLHLYIAYKERAIYATAAGAH